MKIYTDLDLRGNKLINAELEDPSFDGDVTVPTRPVGDNSTKVANTAFVHNEIIASVDDELSTESEKAVQNKVVTENLEAIMNAFPSDTAEGEIASFVDGAENLPVAELSVEIEAQQNLNGYSNPWPPAGGKNKAQMRTNTQSSNGITVTANANGTVNISGTATADASVLLVGNFTEIGTLIAAGGTFSLSSNTNTPYNASTFNVTVAYSESGTTKFLTIGSTATIAAGATLVDCNVYVPSGVTVTSVNNFALQLESGAKTDFAPYSNICPIYSQAEKNILPMTLAGIKAINTSGTWSGNTYTWNGTTYTLLTDNSENIVGIKVNTPSSASANNWLFLENGSADYWAEVSGKSFIINGCPVGGNASTYYLSIYVSGQPEIKETGRGANKTYPTTEVSHNVTINVLSGASVNNAVFYPMLRSAANPDTTYVPYRCVARVDVEGKNIINPATCVRGLLNQNTGELAYADRWITTEFIKVTGDSVVVSGWRKGAESCFCVRFVEYDENKNWIFGAGNLNVTADQYWTKTRTLHTGAAYVRISFGFDNKVMTLEAFFATNDVQLEFGSTATEYEAFKDRTYFSLAKNVWDEEWELGSIDASTGADVTANTNIRSVGYMSCSPNTNYYAKFPDINEIRLAIYFYDENKNFISPRLVLPYVTTFTTPSNATYIRFYATSEYGTTYNGDIAILNAPPEIYGGELSVTTGKLKVDYRMLDFGSLPWGTFNDGRFYNSAVQDFAQVVTVAGVPYGEAICSMYKFIQNGIGASGADGVCNLFMGNYGGNNGRIFVRDYSKASMTTTQFKEAMSGVQFAYKLANPQVYQLDPVQVKTWLAKNNVTANTGTVRITYRANTSLYIEKKLG